MAHAERHCVGVALEGEDASAVDTLIEVAASAVADTLAVADTFAADTLAVADTLVAAASAADTLVAAASAADTLTDDTLVAPAASVAEVIALRMLRSQAANQTLRVQIDHRMHLGMVEGLSCEEQWHERAKSRYEMVAAAAVVVVVARRPVPPPHVDEFHDHASPPAGHDARAPRRSPSRDHCDCPTRADRWRSDESL